MSGSSFFLWEQGVISKQLKSVHINLCWWTTGNVSCKISPTDNKQKICDTKKKKCEFNHQQTISKEMTCNLSLKKKRYENHSELLFLLNVFNFYWQGLTKELKCLLNILWGFRVDFHRRRVGGLMLLLPKSLHLPKCQGFQKGMPLSFVVRRTHRSFGVFLRKISDK